MDGDGQDGVTGRGGMTGRGGGPDGRTDGGGEDGAREGAVRGPVGSGEGGQVDAALLDALFAQAPIGLYLLDHDLRVIRYNGAARGVRGMPGSDIVGHQPADFAPGFDRGELEALARHALQDGGYVREHLVRGRMPADPRHEMVGAISFFRILSDTGSPYLVAAVEDVTEQQTALDRLDILHSAHRSLGASLDAIGSAQELTDVAVPRFADSATVDLLDEPLRGLPLRTGPIDPGAPLRRAAYRSVHGAGPAGPSPGPVPHGALSTYGAPTPYSQSLEDGRPRLIRGLGGEEQWLASDPERGRRLTGLGVHSMIVAPLVVHDAVLGVLALYRHRRPEPFDQDDLELAVELASRGAMSIDKARSYARERSIATTLQRQLLPREPVELSAVQSAHVYLPGVVGPGGDWYDVVPLSAARVGLAIGSVTGTGIEAAAVMGQVRTALRTLAVQDLAPDELLVRLDDAARVLTDEQRGSLPAGADSLPDGLASCLYLVYDPIGRTCTAASAGHPGPVVVGPDGVPVPFPVEPGLPLGCGDGCYETRVAELPVGSVLALYTNGLMSGPPRRTGVREGTGAGEGTGAERGGLDEVLPVGPGEGRRAVLQRVLARAGEEELAQLCDQAVYALLPERQREDAVLLLVRTLGLPDDKVAVWTLPEDPAVVRTARRLAEHQLAAWGLTELEFATDLIVSELVTNAIRYGKSPIRLRLINDRGLICEVSDSSDSTPHLRRAKSTDEGGRGLFIIGQLAQRWGTRFARHGKTIWAQQQLPEGELPEGEGQEGADGEGAVREGSAGEGELPG
ncbi:ATP-binding SpoIIE family protein phosphatase [Kitasatospora cineracea]|uniref:PAS domain S-box-containing protein n=1 Tax=Kitasatospora cineracea TaxID=88074 RepID=A0A3N4R9T4_9ACTN|nr:SpoIIE family protein phosphatase [Kitasatospora cineracea]RPE29436.1 PAS domain S-box-containing protein [Kitasatospora cineracea]